MWRGCIVCCFIYILIFVFSFQLGLVCFKVDILLVAISKIAVNKNILKMSNKILKILNYFTNFHDEGNLKSFQRITFCGKTKKRRTTNISDLKVLSQQWMFKLQKVFKIHVILRFLIVFNSKIKF